MLLADPTRRASLERLAEVESPLSELAGLFWYVFAGGWQGLECF